MDAENALACGTWYGHHSDDRVLVNRGRTEPDLMCGRHAYSGVNIAATEKDA